MYRETREKERRKTNIDTPTTTSIRPSNRIDNLVKKITASSAHFIMSCERLPSPDDQQRRSDYGILIINDYRPERERGRWKLRVIISSRYRIYELVGCYTSEAIKTNETDLPSRLTILLVRRLLIINLLVVFLCLFYVHFIDSDRRLRLYGVYYTYIGILVYYL